MTGRTALLALTIFLAPPLAVIAQETGPPQATWPECDEFIPSSPCKIVVQMAPTADGYHLTRSHWDVVIKPAGTASVILEHSSPFLSCTLTASPSPLSRDVSSSVTTFLTALGTLGAAGNAVIQTLPLAPRAVPPRTPPNPDADKIEHQLGRLESDLDASLAQLQYDFGRFNAANTDLQKSWLYAYPSDGDFAAKAKDLWTSLSKVLDQPIPNIATTQIESKALDSAIAEFHHTYDGDPSTTNWSKIVNDLYQTDNGRLSLLQEHLTVLLNIRTQLKQAHDVLASLSDDPANPGTFDKPDHHYTTNVLPLSYFSEKQVTEAITCKDVVTQAQAFDVVTFTAYYEDPQKWDLSAGAVVSLIGGRQVGTLSGPLSQGSAPTLLGITSSSRIQWIPAAFVEYHPLRFKCPWATNGAPTHRWGYVCTFGPAFGLLVNPNNGATTAEYFEGVSLGIQRVAFFFGNHTGKVQEFGEGYYVGETVPTGTTPPTLRRWTNHPAFGISYRIPLR
jgi:hypothetical protein